MSIQTDRERNYVVSRLSIVRATPNDAGSYKCAPDLVHPANSTVFVVEGNLYSTNGSVQSINFNDRNEKDWLFFPET